MKLCLLSINIARRAANSSQISVGREPGDDGIASIVAEANTPKPYPGGASRPSLVCIVAPTGEGELQKVRMC